jgi:hypothetical protein
MIDITRFAELVPGDHGLAVVALALPDRTLHPSVASVGVLNHPSPVPQSSASSPVAGPAKLDHLRSHPRATVVLRAG